MEAKYSRTTSSASGVGGIGVGPRCRMEDALGRAFIRHQRRGQCPCRDCVVKNKHFTIRVHKMLEVQSLYKPTPAHQPTAKRRRLRLTSVPLVDLRAPQGEGSLDGGDLYGSLSSPPKSFVSDVDAASLSNKSGICSISDSMDNNGQRLQGSCRIRHLNNSWESESRFPKLNECAHFHYEFVELGPIDVCLYDEESQENCIKPSTSTNNEQSNTSDNFSVQVSSNGKSWVVRRSYENFRMLDRQLHQCVYDRKFSALPEIRNREYDSRTVVTVATVKDVVYDDDDDDVDDGDVDHVDKQRLRQAAKKALAANLSEYLHRFSDIAGNLISCGPILNWLELDNRGNRLIVTDDSAINTPAVAAAYVTKRYISQATDEISFEVGDMISVIDMPPSDESIWWRGKRGFEVGFFPSECVEVIGDKVPHTIHIPKAPTKPVLRKHGKLIAFFRSFILSRPSRRKLKQSGILRERVFGCDLGEHLLNSGHDIPKVLKCCADFIEAHGIVDGIYRLSGVTSNIQKLRNTFDEDRVPNLNDEAILQDIHSVASLLKMYFRELPNPLLTYQLYDKFVAAVQSDEELRLLNVRDIVQQMPPPHYRTLEHLVKHLARVAAHGGGTGMTPKNLAIVWAPNLLRSKDLEVGGVAALQVVGVQAVVTEFLIHYSDLIFNDKMPVFPPIQDVSGGSLKRNRPKSLAISTPTKLLTLEEARSRALGTMPGCQFSQKYIEVGGGPATLPSKYHTIIDLPDRKRGSTKNKKSPSGWKSFFSSKGRSSSQSSRDGEKNRRKTSTTPSDPGICNSLADKAVTDVDASHKMNRLRSVKSAESLISSCATSSHRSSDVLDGTVGVPMCSADMGSPTLFAVADDDNEDGDSDGNHRGIDMILSSSLGAVQSRHSPHSHHRSVSHDSYFEFTLDRRRDERPPAELSTILSEDYEDNDTADIRFADQDSEICENTMTTARLSIDFDDVPCDIVGDIQGEVAAALHWDKDPNDNNKNDIKNVGVIECGVVKIVDTIKVDKHFVDITSEKAILEGNVRPAEACLDADDNLIVAVGLELSPTTSACSMARHTSLPDILDHSLSLGLKLSPCDSLQDLSENDILECQVKAEPEMTVVYQHPFEDSFHHGIDINAGEFVTVAEEPKLIVLEQNNLKDLDSNKFGDVSMEPNDIVLNQDNCTLEDPDVVNLCDSGMDLQTNNDDEVSLEDSDHQKFPDNIVVPKMIIPDQESIDVQLSKITSCDQSSFEDFESGQYGDVKLDFKINVVHQHSLGDSDVGKDVDDSVEPKMSVAEQDAKIVPSDRHQNADADVEMVLTTSSSSVSPVTSSIESIADPFAYSVFTNEEEVIEDVSRNDENKENDADSLKHEEPIEPNISLSRYPLVVMLDKLSPVEESKRKFESEIGRDILRERKMKLELEKVQHVTMVTPDINASVGVNSHVESEVTLRGTSDFVVAESANIELKRSSEPTVSVNWERTVDDQKRHSDQTRSPTKHNRPERKASVRELMSKFESGQSSSSFGGSGCVIPTQSKDNVDNSAVFVDLKPPIRKKTRSTGTPTTPPTESAATPIDSMIVTPFSDQLLSKSASGKLETFGSIGDEEPNVISSSVVSISTSSKNVDISESARRERIDRYKEERRAQLREKIRSESFKGERDSQTDYLLRLKQKAVSPTKHFDGDSTLDDRLSSSGFVSPRRRSRLSAGSPVDDKTKTDGFVGRRRSVHVQQSVAAPQSDLSLLPVSPRKMKDTRKILSLVADNTVQLQTSHRSKESLKSPDIEIVKSAESVSSHSYSHPPQPPPRKIKDVAALFEQQRMDQVPKMIKSNSTVPGSKVPSG